MRAYAKKVITHPLFSGSALMIFGSNFANFFAYVYHFVVGRLLSPESYGSLGAILSLIGLVSVSIQFLGLVIVKFISSSKEKERQAIYIWFKNVFAKGAIIIGLLSLILSPILSSFLHIDLIIILLIVPILVLSVCNFFYKSVLQGILKFGQLVLSSNLELIVRLIAGVVFILFGWSVFGATAGIAAGALVNFIFLKYYLRNLDTAKVKKKFNMSGDVVKYALPIFIASFFTYAMISFDVILVKHFQSAEEAGVYTVLSVLGKIVFFAASPIISVMFPIIAKRQSENKDYRGIFRLSMLMTTAMVFSLIIGFRIFPNIAIGVLYGADRYLEAYPLLYLFGIFIGFYTLSSQIINYYLSIGKTGIVKLLPFALISQVVGITLFHKTLLEIVWVSIAASGLLFFILVFRLIYDKKI